jgi:hypothetical protein
MHKWRISRQTILETGKLVCERFLNKARLAQQPECPVADGVDGNRRPPKLGLEGRGHTHRVRHDLRYADHLECTLTAPSHVCAHFFVRLGRRAGCDGRGNNGTKGDSVAQAEVHSLAASGRVNMGGVADETDPGSAGSSCSCFLAIITKVGEEGLRSGVAREEARRPHYFCDRGTVRVLALVRAERVRAVRINKVLAVLHSCLGGSFAVAGRHAAGQAVKGFSLGITRAMRGILKRCYDEETCLADNSVETLWRRRRFVECDVGDDHLRQVVGRLFSGGTGVHEVYA